MKRFRGLLDRQREKVHTLSRYDSRGRMIRKCWVCHTYDVDECYTIPVECNVLTGSIYYCGYVLCLETIEERLRNATIRDKPGGTDLQFDKVVGVYNKFGWEEDHVLEEVEAPPAPSAPAPIANAGNGATATAGLSMQFPATQGAGMSREDMVNTLIARDGTACQGCYREFDDPLYLELDHSRPKSGGGEDHIGNRVLLCSPCNRIKSNKITLSGLHDHNTKAGRMMEQPADDRAIPLPQSLKRLEQGELT